MLIWHDKRAWDCFAAYGPPMEVAWTSTWPSHAATLKIPLLLPNHRLILVIVVGRAAYARGYTAKAWMSWAFTKPGPIRCFPLTWPVSNTTRYACIHIQVSSTRSAQFFTEGEHTKEAKRDSLGTLFFGGDASFCFSEKLLLSDEGRAVSFASFSWRSLSLAFCRVTRYVESSQTTRKSLSRTDGGCCSCVVCHSTALLAAGGPRKEVAVPTPG
jgi:hypothetical protein